MGVNIVLPDGAQATVNENELQQALAAGATLGKQGETYEKEFGGLLGQAASAVFGAGRVASGGLMDAALIDGAYLYGGNSAAEDMKHGLNVAKETNPYSTMGGEAAGLFVGAGEGVMALGSAVEHGVAAQAGKGLLGSVASMGARGAVEASALGYGKAISETTLGDPNENGEKVFATVAKDALLGGVIGGGFGLLGHGASGLISSLRHGPGPRSGALLDEVAGASGAGRAVAEEAHATESLVKDLQKAGATSEQAAIMADEINSLAKAHVAGTESANPFLSKAGKSAFDAEIAGGGLSSWVDSAAAKFAAARSGGNPAIEEALTKGYSSRASRLIESRQIVDDQSKRLVEAGTKMMRAEEVMDRLGFTERPQQFERLMKASEVDVDRAADAVMKMTQMADMAVAELESVPLMSREALSVKKMREAMTVTYKKHAALIDATTGAARESALRDLYMSTYQLKQEVGRLSGFGAVDAASAMVRPVSSIEGHLRGVYETLRTGLEDEAVWGAAGKANRELNEAFSTAFARRRDFGKKFAVSIDELAGTAKPEVDFDKVRGILSDLRGSDVDGMRQAVKDADAFVDGIRQRATATENNLSLTAADKAAIAQAREAANVFETTFAEARKEATVVNRLKDLQLEEQGKALGGTIGFLTDIVTRPVTTMERLGAVKVATQKLEKAIEGGLSRFFGGGKGKAALPAPALRSPEAVTKEIGQLRELAANPMTLQARVASFVGDLTKYAPQTAEGVKATALRLVTYLAVNAPQPQTSRDFAGRIEERYSPTQLASYERKREAAFDPKTVLREMDIGALNRDGIRAVKFIYPTVFAQMQEKANAELVRRAADGSLDMTREQKKSLAALLEVAADGTFEPKFIASMQATTAPSTEAAPPAAPAAMAKRPIKLDTNIYRTDAQQIEGRAAGA